MVLGWQAGFFSYHSLGLVSREVVSRMLMRGVDVHPENVEPPDFEPMGRTRIIYEKIKNSFLPKKYDIHIRCRWPPNFEKVGRKNVLIQPWEIIPIPKSWLSGLENIDMVLADSSFTAQCFREGGYDKVDVVPHGVSEEFHPSKPPTIALDGFKFLFVGGVIPRKGIDLVLKAYLTLFKKTDPVHLIIKGMLSDTLYRYMTLKDEIIKIMKDPNSPKIYYFETNLRDDEIPSLYTSAHVLLHPFRAEGFALPVLEALACGVPVITTGYGPVLDYIPRDYKYLLKYKLVEIRYNFEGEILTGVIAEPDFDDFVRKILDIMKNYGEAKKNAMEIGERIRREMNWERIVELYLKKFEELM